MNHLNGRRLYDCNALGRLAWHQQQWEIAHVMTLVSFIWTFEGIMIVERHATTRISSWQ